MLRYTCLSLLLVGALLGMGTPTYAQDERPVISTSDNAPLPSLRDAVRDAQNRPSVVLPNYIVPNKQHEDDRTINSADVIGADPVLQSAIGPSAPAVLGANFDGASNVDNATTVGGYVAPPDTDGDVGPNHYVQMINLVTTIYDKSGGIIMGPFASDFFWSGLSSVCGRTNRGDPIVVYDETNDRWLVSQFAFSSTSSPPWYQCVAISQTGDPTGAYNRYAFDLSSFGFNDYPKHGITTQSITLMANLFNPFFRGTLLAAMDKNAMYAGQAASIVAWNLGGSEFGFVAGDLDDAAGTAGFVPALFGTAMSTSQRFDIWEIDVDWSNPGAATVNRIARLPISGFDNDFCTASREACIPQPSPGRNLEALSGRLMQRLQIRDFGAYRTMLASHTVDADGTGRAGIRWYELRETNGTWSLHQQGTYAPNDGLHRWMPSIAMNAAGDIGVGYMLSGNNTFVSTAVAGQTAGATGSGTFDTAETVCKAGTGVQDDVNRAGDYSATVIDPVTDTFWHTNEYFPNRNIPYNWATRICEFSVGTGTSNTPPVVNITRPTADSTVTEGDGFTLAASATDAEDGNISSQVDWSSNLSGNLGTGANIGVTLSVGVHTVTAAVTDANGASDSDTIQITVEAETNANPAVSITSPADGSSFSSGATINFTGTASDPEDGGLTASIAWSSSIDGDLTPTGGSINVVLSDGNHTVTASVTDSGGKTATDAISVTVGTPPTADKLYVDAISTSSQGAGRNSRIGTATVTVRDNLGGLVGSVLVEGQFSGTFNEDASATTDGSGVADLQTSSTTRDKQPVVDFCVIDLTLSGYTYDETLNSDPNFDCGGSGSGDPNLVHVELIVTGTDNVGQGNKRGTATVTIVDGTGAPVPDASVGGQFGGSFNESASGSTNSAGDVSLTTSGTAKGGVSVSFCVSSVLASGKTYDPLQNSDSGYDCSGSSKFAGGSTQPERFRLEGNYPNPFNPTTMIGYELAESAEVTLSVFTVDGREVARLVDGRQDAGRHQVAFDATHLSAGVYLYVLRSPEGIQTRRMTLLK